MNPATSGATSDSQPSSASDGGLVHAAIQTHETLPTTRRSLEDTAVSRHGKHARPQQGAPVATGGGADLAADASQPAVAGSGDGAGKRKGIDDGGTAAQEQQQPEREVGQQSAESEDGAEEEGGADVDEDDDSLQSEADTAVDTDQRRDQDRSSGGGGADNKEHVLTGRVSVLGGWG